MIAFPINGACTYNHLTVHLHPIKSQPSTDLRLRKREKNLRKSSSSLALARACIDFQFSFSFSSRSGSISSILFRDVVLAIEFINSNFFPIFAGISIQLRMSSGFSVSEIF